MDINFFFNLKYISFEREKLNKNCALHLFSFSNIHFSLNKYETLWCYRVFNFKTNVSGKIQ